MKQQNDKGGLYSNLRPQFPGPIGNPKAGVQARFSFVRADGKRHYHVETQAMLPARKARNYRLTKP